MNSRAKAGCEIVSFEQDELLLVNENDDIIGTADKGKCHDGEGLLHRAFSILLFNSKGELLLQKRAASKRLWGGYWSNSCCSHPRSGESMEYAAHRRLEEELGLSSKLTYVYKFQYHAEFISSASELIGSERELCWVYVGWTDATPSPNSHEVSDIRYISSEDLELELQRKPDHFTPWFKVEWAALKNEHFERMCETISVG